MLDDNEWRRVSALFHKGTEGDPKERMYAPALHEYERITGLHEIGVNGGDRHWICFRHLEKWNADRDRFFSDGGGCEIQELGELLCDECAAKEL